MLALIAGRGDLPLAVQEALPNPALVCALDNALPDRLTPDHVFRLERLGGFLAWLQGQGVRQVCFCGAVSRPALSLWQVDRATLALLPRLYRMLKQGDDGAIRIAIALFEEAGFEVLAAHQVAPALLPPAGVLTRVAPADWGAGVAVLGDTISARQAQEDLGQACILSGKGVVLAREGQEGTDAMLAGLDEEAAGAVLYKAPKPGQERRGDLPVIGPRTAEAITARGMAGIVIEAGGVMVLHRETVIRILDRAGAFLWVRERPL